MGEVNPYILPEGNVQISFSGKAIGYSMQRARFVRRIMGSVQGDGLQTEGSNMGEVIKFNIPQKVELKRQKKRELQELQSMACDMFDMMHYSGLFSEEYFEVMDQIIWKIYCVQRNETS